MRGKRERNNEKVTNNERSNKGTTGWKKKKKKKQVQKMQKNKTMKRLRAQEDIYGWYFVTQRVCVGRQRHNTMLSFMIAALSFITEVNFANIKRFL